MMSLPFVIPTNSLPDLRATAQWMTLEPGLYTLRVTGGAAPAGNIGVPFVQIAEAPGNLPTTTVNFLGETSANLGALSRSGDTLVIRVSGGAARMVLTSYTAANQTSGLAVEVVCLNASRNGSSAASAQGRPSQLMQRVVPIELIVHVQNRGDLRFADGGWAGCPEQRQWIESFTVTPLEGMTPADIEYKGLTAAGWETPWIGGGTPCGTRGLGVPLIGFAVRLRDPASAAFECVCEAQFVSGARVGPVPGGVLCRSDTVADPLDGLLIRLVAKPTASAGW